MTLTYTEKEGYLYPDLKAPEQSEEAITKYALLRDQHLKAQNKMVYNLLLLRGELKTHLLLIQQQSEELLEQLIKQMAEQEKVTEELKARDPILWAKQMNSIRNRISGSIAGLPLSSL